MKTTQRRLSIASLTLAAAAAGALTGCLHDDDDDDDALAERPAFVTGTPGTADYDGNADDLLTAGLGAAGLAGAAPGYANASAPTPAELRRNAIYNNYRAIVDITANGGYMRLYGPNIAADGTVGTGSGKIAGTEVLAYADDGSGRQNVTMMVQLPSTFDRTAPCIVSATSSGSRGVYGAIGSAGEWGLKRGCAVAYTDKGTGNGVHDLQADTVNRIDGVRVSAATAAASAVSAAQLPANFTARLSGPELAAFNTATPNRFAVKHAHSEQNPEKDWGKHTLQAIEFAMWVLNDRLATRDTQGRARAEFTRANTLVIASSVSNGAGAALAAAEQDTAGWIDGVAVSEPSIQIAADAAARIERGTRPAVTGGAKPLYDYFSFGNLLQPCAALAAGAAGSPFAFAGANATVAANRCAALATNNLVSGATTQERADDALAKLRAYGWEPETDVLHASHWQFATPAIAATYSNTYGRFRVSDNLCGFSFASVDATGVPAAASATQAAQIAQIFGSGNGIPPTGPIQLVWNTSVGGARLQAAGTSPSTGLPDFSFDGAACQRQLWTGSAADATKLKGGVNEVLRSANLQGKPTLIVHGRADTLVPTNFNSRPYVLRNAQVEGSATKVRYIEVTNAQHFDAFLGFAGYDTRYVPLHLYFNRAMDAMYAHLKNGVALPGSQVVRTTPRGGTPGAAPANLPAQLPPIATVPAAGDAITISGNTLRIPD